MSLVAAQLKYGEVSTQKGKAGEPWGTLASLSKSHVGFRSTSPFRLSKTLKGNGCQILTVALLAHVEVKMSKFSGRVANHLCHDIPKVSFFSSMKAEIPQLEDCAIVEVCIGVSHMLTQDIKDDHGRALDVYFVIHILNLSHFAVHFSSMPLVGPPSLRRPNIVFQCQLEEFGNLRRLLL